MFYVFSFRAVNGLRQRVGCNPVAFSSPVAVMRKMKAERIPTPFEPRPNVHDLQSGLMQQFDERLVRARGRSAMLDGAGPQGARRHDEHDRAAAGDEIAQARRRGLHLVVRFIRSGNRGQTRNQEPRSRRRALEAR
jgi:hypothetical protein